MRLKTLSVAAAASLVAAAAFTAPAEAGGRHGDAVVAGAAGFALGTLFGTAVAQPRYVAPAPVYVRPAPVYIEPEPVYIAPPPPLLYEPAPVVYYAPEPWTGEWYAYCADRYQSFDARSGTFIGRDGRAHLCR
jgi:hypothetical protein